MKIIILIDPLWNGHHPTYFKLFSKALLESGHYTIALCPEPSELEEWISLNCPQELLTHFNAFHLKEAKTIYSPISRLQPDLAAVSLWLAAKYSIQDAIEKLGVSPDIIFFAWLDSYLGRNLVSHITDFIFPYNWSGLYFIPKYLRKGQKMPFIRHGFLDPCAVLHSSRCLSVSVLDEGIAEKLEKKIRKPVIIFPDITDDSYPDLSFKLAQEIVERAKGRKIIGLVGELAKRKGMLTLIEVARKSSKLDWMFIFVGGLASSTFSLEELSLIKSFIESSPSNCYFHLERVPDEPKFNALIYICNILFAVYDDFWHSSNILTKAAIFEKPVVVNDMACMGERIRKFNIGLGINNVERCIEAIQWLCEEEEHSFYRLKPSFEEYKKEHSFGRLNAAFSSVINIFDNISLKN